jgi:uncharacterized damage-inducible protein DinB
MRERLVVVEIPGYPAEIGAALWRLEDARSRTMRLLADVPQEYVDQETGGNTMGAILYHMADIEADWLYVEILEESIPDELRALFPVGARDEAGILSVVRGQTLEEHLARLATVRADLLARLRGMTAAEFRRPRNLPQYEVSPEWVLHHLAQHEAEHRGELGSAIARLQGRGPSMN